MKKDQQEIPVLVDRKCEPGWKLYFPDGAYFEVIRQNENIFSVVLKSERSLSEMLELYGETPIPHYLEDDTQEESHLRERYQTVFAHEGASVAAPTASLHFTDRVFDSLDAKHIGRTEVTLNVGLGTFAPLREEHFDTGRLHSETALVSPETAEVINQAKRDQRRVVAVGTTAMRTLESVGREGSMRPFVGATDIFIYPPYTFRIADALVTNFHLPQTSLMLLVDAFLEHKQAKRRINELYQEAIREGYAFYSFGDSMLIL
jgi:S-adenosylmethionine:tRNA ribosyltransferase-isomerase